ncbi:MAG: ribonuclease III [Candidatus Dojkabacteria bacterium]
MISEKEKIKLNNLEKRIKVKFDDISLLKQALVHRSYLNEAKDSKLIHNERLEFLGDAVLELIVTKYLYAEYPERNEGDLTSFRAATVRTESLADTALEIELGDYIYMSKGEESTGGRTRPYILANTFEALLGAIYLSEGIETSTTFVETFLLPKVAEIVEKRLDIDSKSKLQEVAQEELSITPDYELISTKGPDHSKTFTMAVLIGDHRLGTGEGKSKQEAEQNAAQDALDDWQQLVKTYFS